MATTQPTNLAILFAAISTLAFSQGSNPLTPSKDYIRLGGNLIATENAAPVVSLSPTSLNFGGQTVGTTSSGQTVTLTNTGSVALTVGAVAISGADPNDFSSTNTCTAPVQSNQTCSITVTFKPTATNTRIAALTITDNPATSPQSVTLTGSGGAATPALTLSPASLPFANQYVGTTSAGQPITLKNTGTAALSITSVALGGANPGDFAFTNGCGVSLAINATCTLTVTFSPTAMLGRTANLTISDNAAGSPQSVSLSGTGLAAVVALSPASLTFTAQNVSTTSPSQTVNLQNTGNSALSISSVNLSGTNAGDFSLVNNCGNSVAAGSACGLAVSFKPTAAGNRTASLVTSDNAGGSPQTVPLSGTGAAPNVVFSAASLAFGNQTLGGPAGILPLTLTNNGNGALSITSATFGGANPGDFTLGAGANACGNTVAAGGNCIYYVTFLAGAQGSRSASLSVTDNASGSPQTIPLSGTGVVPVISLSATSLYFGNQNKNTTSSPQTLTITNSGAGVLYFSWSTGSPYNIPTGNGGTCTGVLAPKANCTVNITFKPTSDGPQDGSLGISDNASGSPQSVGLYGYGIN